ncbi:unnamed protein product [Nesidiocoris tenuis]|uniref:Reverse transcriptase domain-containing protein n=1 Tax=Nesidiocoris tenuis TaxID=355587 RepID=A0A6H5GGI6_9HEMI|nr:unnamed protein product [Nesidiocoris tenuis]
MTQYTTELNFIDVRNQVPMVIPTTASCNRIAIFKICIFFDIFDFHTPKGSQNMIKSDDNHTSYRRSTSRTAYLHFIENEFLVSHPRVESEERIVPQGSVLGPILYTIFSSDFPAEPELTVAHFADDVAVLSKQASCRQAAEELQKMSVRINEWCQKWRVRTRKSHKISSCTLYLSPHLAASSVHTIHVKLALNNSIFYSKPVMQFCKFCTGKCTRLIDLVTTKVSMSQIHQKEGSRRKSRSPSMSDSASSTSSDDDSEGPRFSPQASSIFPSGSVCNASLQDGPGGRRDECIISKGRSACNTPNSPGNPVVDGRNECIVPSRQSVCNAPSSAVLDANATTMTEVVPDESALQKSADAQPGGNSADHDVDPQHELVFAKGERRGRTEAYRLHVAGHFQVFKPAAPDFSCRGIEVLQRATTPITLSERRDTKGSSEIEESPLAAQAVEELKERSATPALERAYPGGGSLIRQAFLMKHVSEKAADTLIQSLSTSTLKQYEVTFKSWWKYCQDHNVNPLHAQVEEKPNLCVATLIMKYLEVTRPFRESSMDDKLFLCHQKPHRPAKRPTISRWVKETLKEAGVDTSIFSAYSTRHAATSDAYRKGVSIDTIRSSAGWSPESSVFARFYNRPLTESPDEFTNRVFQLDPN